jgi:hypothetical protein
MNFLERTYVKFPSSVVLRSLKLPRFLIDAYRAEAVPGESPVAAGLTERWRSDSSN